MLGTSVVLHESTYDAPGTYLVEVCVRVRARYCHMSHVTLACSHRAMPAGAVPDAAPKERHHAANDHTQRHAVRGGASPCTVNHCRLVPLTRWAGFFRRFIPHALLSHTEGAAAAAAAAAPFSFAVD